MNGSVRSAIQRPLNCAFHEGFLGVVTLEPSALTILFGSAIIRGIITPTIVSTRNVIWAERQGVSTERRQDRKIR